MKLLVRCYECDSEYTIEYEDGLISDDPQFCVVCKHNKIDVEEIQDDLDI